MAEFTHFNESGRARMVDVGAKAQTERVATAQAKVYLQPETLEKIQRGKIAKGDVLAVAQVAGVMGAKKTPDLIPMCHPLLVTSVDISFKEESQLDREGRCSITVSATAKQTRPRLRSLPRVESHVMASFPWCRPAPSRMATS